MLNQNNYIKSQLIQLKIEALIRKGNSHYNLINEIVRGYDASISRKLAALKQLPVIDLRQNLRILEIMRYKTFLNLQNDVYTTEIESHIAFLNNSIAGYRENLLKFYAVEYQRFKLLEEIKNLNLKIFRLKNSRVLKFIENAIKNKQALQNKLTIFEVR